MNNTVAEPEEKEIKCRVLFEKQSVLQEIDPCGKRAPSKLADLDRKDFCSYNLPTNNSITHSIIYGKQRTLEQRRNSYPSAGSDHIEQEWVYK
jgi:hypothetical protein